MTIAPAEIINDDLFSYKAEYREKKDDTHDQIENEDKIKSIIRSEPISPDPRFLVKTESHLLQLAYTNNKILSLSNSRTRILAHQVESTHIIVNALKQRFLIADEVGLGKTIEGGLVLKELIYRYDYKRILIVAPAPLLYQWQSEMQSKFNEHFEILNRKVLKKAEAEVGEDGNPWYVHDRVICSIDFIKNDSFAQDIAQTKWDAVVFDEAHRLRRDSNNSTLAYNAAEIISEKTEALLLLSATPFRGKLEELYYLIALVDKNILGPFHSFYNEFCYEGADLSQLQKKLSTVIIRRTKNEIGGFTKRFAKTIKFELYPNERFLYDETTRYVAEEFNRALQEENRAVGFVMTVFQKLLDSSSYALSRALQNRMSKLKQIVSRAESDELIIDNLLETIDPDLIDDSENIEDQVDASIKKTVSELKDEIKTLKRLVGIAERIDYNKKGEKLVELIGDLKKKGRKKFLIFTQFRTTQDYLKEILNNYNTVIFNGSMTAEQKEQAILDFKGDAEVLIATEAGGEGRNMQFCSILVNYDLPWSPLKVEQRIGRIHRFGQPQDVLIYNFSTSDTVAERILEVLSEKLRLFEESIGAPDIMLGEIEDELKLNNLFMEMVAGSKKKKNIDDEIDGRVEMARKSYEKLSDLTVTDKMDFNYDEYYRITLKERQFSNKRIENFINRLQETDDHSFASLGRKNKRNKLYAVKPGQLGNKIKGKYGTFNSQTALDNENLEFLAFGHPIIDSLIDYCQDDKFGGFTGIRYIGYQRNFIGMLFNYVVEFESMTRVRKFMPVVIEPYGILDSSEIDEVELETIEQDFVFVPEIKRYGTFISDMVKKTDELFAKSKERILDKVNKKSTEMTLDLDIHLDPEIEKISKSYELQIKELQDKLEIQTGQMKWYGKDMRGAITRTRNRIMKAEREKELQLSRYRGYMGIKSSIKLINAGIIICK